MCSLGTRVQTCALPIFLPRGRCATDGICRTHRPAHGTMADPADDPGRPLPDPDSQRPRGTERGSKWERPCRLTFPCRWRSGLRVRLKRAVPFPSPIRSDEHTSELQSLMRISYAVFCLKKKIDSIHNNN